MGAFGGRERACARLVVGRRGWPFFAPERKFAGDGGGGGLRVIAFGALSAVRDRLIRKQTDRVGGKGDKVRFPPRKKRDGFTVPWTPQD